MGIFFASEMVKPHRDVGPFASGAAAEAYLKTLPDGGREFMLMGFSAIVPGDGRNDGPALRNVHLPELLDPWNGLAVVSEDGGTVARLSNVRLTDDCLSFVADIDLIAGSHGIEPHPHAANQTVPAEVGSALEEMVSDLINDLRDAPEAATREEKEAGEKLAEGIDRLMLGGDPPEQETWRSRPPML